MLEAFDEIFFIADMPTQIKFKNRPIDQIDRKVLSLLQKDARLTNSDIAERAGLSATACWNRIKRLEAEGYITGYVALLDQEKMGLPETVLIEVTLERHDDATLERFGNGLAQMPEVLEAYLTTGEYDYMIKVAVAGTASYEWFLRERLYRLPGIRHSRSSFCLRRLKFSASVEPQA